MTNHNTPPLRRIAFYVTGHGFGHSTRVLEVLRHLSPDTEIHVKTSAPEWLYRLDLERPFHFHELDHDVGCVQVDSLEVLPRETLLAFDRLWRGRESIIVKELEFLEDNNIDCLIADISPLACVLARRAGLPSVVIANFTWAWIYEPYVQDNPDLAHVIDWIREAYADVTLCLRTPLDSDLSVFPRIEDVPLIGRHARLEGSEVRRRLGVREDRQLVLLTFGGFQTRALPLDSLQAVPDTLFITTVSQPQAASNMIQLKPADFRHPDLVAASDLVIAKPGYGIVSECIANGTPLLLVRRKDFREAGILENEIQRLGGGRVMTAEDILSGNLGRHVQEALDAGLKWEPISANGGEVAARRIESFV